MLLIFAKVIPLGWDTFDDYTTKIVKFYAPWCGHCKAFAPEFVKFSEMTNLTSGEVDCTAEEKLCHKFQITGFPTVKIFIGDKMFDYDGERKADMLKLYVDLLQRPALELDRSVNTSAYHVTFYTMDTAADESLFLGLKGKVQIMTKIGERRLTASVEGREITYNGDFTRKSIEEFAYMYKHGFFPEMTPESFYDLAMRTLAVFVHDETQSYYYLERRARDFPRQKLNYAHLNGEQWADYLAEFGCVKMPCAIFIDQYMKYGREIASEEDFMMVVNYFENGQLSSANNRLNATYQHAKDIFLGWIRGHGYVAYTFIIAGILVAIMFAVCIPLMVLIMHCCAKKQSKAYSDLSRKSLNKEEVSATQPTSVNVVKEIVDNKPDIYY